MYEFIVLRIVGVPFPKSQVRPGWLSSHLTRGGEPISLPNRLPIMLVFRFYTNSSKAYVPNKQTKTAVHAKQSNMINK